MQARVEFFTKGVVNLPLPLYARNPFKSGRYELKCVVRLSAWLCAGVPCVTR